MKKSLQNLAGILALASLPVICPIGSIYAQDYVKPDFWVSDSTGYNYRESALSVGPDGNMVVAWGTSGGGEILFKTITSHGNQISEQKTVTSPTSNTQTRIAHADSGHFMIMYSGVFDGWKMFGQVFDPAGNAIGDTMTLSRNTSEMINSYFATLSSDQNNQFGAFLPGTDSMIVEKVSMDGNFAGNSIVLKPAHASFQNQTGLMTRSGQLILAWVSYADDNIHAQRFTPEGIAIDTAIQVSQKPEAHFIQNMTLSSDTSGNFVVVWSTSKDSTTNMYAQLFTAEGVAVGSNIMITGGYHSIAGTMSASMDIDGNYIVAWEDTRNNDTSFIYLQQVDHTGGKVGDNYRATTVNNQVPEGQSRASQVHPSVRLLRDTIYLAWANYNPDIHYRTSIYASIQKWRVPATGLGQPFEKNARINVYPNPSTGHLTLALDREYNGRLELKVFSASGTMVRHEIRAWVGSEGRFDLSEMPEGLYYLDVNGDSFHSTQAVVIVK